MSLHRRLAQLVEKCKRPGYSFGLALILWACRPSPTPEPVDLPPPPVIESLDDFERAMTEAGADWVVQDPLASPVFETEETSYLLRGEPLLAYEFPDPDTRDEALAKKMDEGIVLPMLTDPPLTSVRIWSPGRLVVLYPGEHGGSLLLLNGLLGDPINLDPPAQDEPYPPAIPLVLEMVAEELGVDPARLEVVDYEPADWEDACLGLPGPGEECPERLTPGWLVTLRVEGEELRVRTDSVGGIIREEP